MLGYKTFTKDITVKDAVNLGIVKLDPDKQVLDAASVSATGNPIVIKKDTIEYNATSFKTTDNDMLEDLLKKLPGVEVGTDGSVTANGQTISKITIDGKTFFWTIHSWLPRTSLRRLLIRSRSFRRNQIRLSLPV